MFQTVPTATIAAGMRSSAGSSYKFKRVQRILCSVKAINFIKCSSCDMGVEKN